MSQIRQEHNVGPDLGPNCKGFQQTALVGKQFEYFVYIIPTPIFILLTCSILVESIVIRCGKQRWLCQKQADLDLQYFQNGKLRDSAGHFFANIVLNFWHIFMIFCRLYRCSN